MRTRNRNICAALLSVTLAAHCLPFLAAGKPRSVVPPATRPTRWQQQQRQQQQQVPDDPEESIEQRDEGQNGITVSEPKIYDDVLLQQMLRTAEARLAGGASGY